MRQPAIVALLTLAVGVSACAYYDDYGFGHGAAGASPLGGYRYEGATYDRSGWSQGSSLNGPGVDLLDPWLAFTPEGHAILAAGFNVGGDLYVGEEIAERANIWFRRYADQNHDMRLTDEEIRIALAHSAVQRARTGY